MHYSNFEKTMKYSKSQINKAGKQLNQVLDEKELDDAILVINDWRTLHLVPLTYLENQLKEILQENRIVSYLMSSRLKRLESIQKKIKNTPDMQLARVHDIGGIRIVLHDIKAVERLKDILKNTAFKGFKRKII